MNVRVRKSLEVKELLDKLVAAGIMAYDPDTEEYYRVLDSDREVSRRIAELDL